ncbi:hypothetical protein SAICODRAFT_68944 [Saitoella complicata NRRL Y-17804]|uniref:DUF7918 domain-containing protein n=1 Tax=Saitoella complicata (strain BCRC 22490 / CBS 7301 / JCM 7358 / NBRC 10748 / NRRL Y-17804) TaxID=698492 RepID=A0A0E9N9B3_SAICN|nr:uncharacterized protein SAICODRAFT_68944 [Saitoella complicata NRRL Y-17804]ODQ55579.1 hypothetical protein SAICODRAFT_68944 [Saitoella complicata NRRL Y-17804]GAO45995.1 hypothetical protein G7K_0240-t1 [Saitoella complicata NRRL Y-17804]
MLFFKGFEVEIRRENAVLEPLGVVSVDSTATITSYVESVAGEAFTIHINRVRGVTPVAPGNHFIPSCLAEISVDGVVVAKGKFNPQSQEWICEGATERRGIIRPFQFGVCAVTDERMECENRHDVLKNFGTIHVRICRIRHSNVPAVRRSREFEVQHRRAIHEDDAIRTHMKHDVTFGLPTPASHHSSLGEPETYTVIDPSTQPYATFEFRYRDGKELERLKLRKPKPLMYIPLPKANPKKRCRDLVEMLEDVSVEMMTRRAETEHRRKQEQRAARERLAAGAPVIDLTDDDPLMPELCIMKPREDSDGEDSLLRTLMVRKRRLDEEEEEAEEQPVRKHIRFKDEEEKEEKQLVVAQHVDVGDDKDDEETDEETESSDEEMEHEERDIEMARPLTEAPPSPVEGPWMAVVKVTSSQENKEQAANKDADEDTARKEHKEHGLQVALIEESNKSKSPERKEEVQGFIFGRGAVVLAQDAEAGWDADGKTVNDEAQAGVLALMNVGGEGEPEEEL